MSIETVESGFAYLESFLNLERSRFVPRQYRLDRMRTLLEEFGNPHLSLPTIHVAGTKGKGSTSAFVAAVLNRAGMRCGLYTSPHVTSYRERIRVLDGALTDEVMLACFAGIERYVERVAPHVPEAELPTTFELLTLLGFLVFREVGCGAAVIEVGLGGRLDATNLVRPVGAAITPIEIEHTDYLGNTLRSIAGEKAGVVKRRTPLFVAPQHLEAAEVISRVARLRSAPEHRLEDAVESIEGLVGLDGTRMRAVFREGPTVAARLRLIGEIQAQNAALASLIIMKLFPAFPLEVIQAGLEEAWLPGRSELLPGEPPILLDGAHTSRSIELVCDTAAVLCPDRDGRALIFGAVKGKNHRDMLAHAVCAFPRIVISRPGSFKDSDIDALAALCAELGGECRLAPEADEALEAALSWAPRLLVVTGSFYLLGEIRAAVARVGRVAS